MTFRVTSYPKFSDNRVVGTFTTQEAAETAAIQCPDNCLVEPVVASDEAEIEHLIFMLSQ